MVVHQPQTSIVTLMQLSQGIILLPRLKKSIHD